MTSFLAIVVLLAALVTGYTALHYSGDDKPVAEAPGEGPDGIRNPPENPPTDTDTRITLSIGETKTVGNLSVTLLSVNDSRCPTGVDCIWAGTVTARIKLMSEADGESETDVGIGARVTTKGGSVTFTSLTPYPAGGDAPEKREYRATFEIELPR